MSIKSRLDNAFFRVPIDREEAVLAQRRVYLLPSGRGYAVAITGVIMLLVGMNYGVSLAYLGAFLIAGYLICALIAAYRNMVNLRITPTTTEDAHAGDAVRFQFALESERERYFITFATPDAVVMLDTIHRGTNALTLHIPATKRGEKKLGRVRVQSIAPTGLIRAFAYVHFPTHAFVYPAALRPAPAIPMNAHNTAPQVSPQDHAPARTQAISSSGDSIDGLREYVQGDAPSRVAWTAAARGQAWRSKVMASDSPRVLTLAWQHTAHLPDIETRLSALTSWVLEAHHRGERYGLSLPSNEIPAAQNGTQRVQCLRALSSFQAG
jgi:uncharacterized protein (DUF58 family)